MFHCIIFATDHLCNPKTNYYLVIEPLLYILAILSGYYANILLEEFFGLVLIVIYTKYTLLYENSFTIEFRTITLCKLFKMVMANFNQILVINHCGTIAIRIYLPWFPISLSYSLFFVGVI